MLKNKNNNYVWDGLYLSMNIVIVCGRALCMEKGRQRKTGLAGKKHWFEKKVLKKPSSDVVLTQNEKGTSTVQSTEQWNTSVDQSPNQLKPLASEGSDYSRLLGENETQQMKQIKAQHVDTLDTVSLVFLPKTVIIIYISV